ncbi:MAG: 4a-hydroxytetrahydrobiopterin dehydratase [Vicinamibacterales bacterium]
MARLSAVDIYARLQGLEGWRLEGHAIVKQYTFSGFPEAVAFVSRLVPGAEAADHHPDVTINYRRVTVSFTTHSEGGLTEKDFAGAATADGCV